MNDTAAIITHPFAHLAAPPYRADGFEVSKFQAIPGDPNCPIQPGTSCDYCGTGIMNVYWLKGSDGRRFKVGSECVYKASKKAKQDTALRALVREVRRQERHRREAARIERGRELLANESIRASLAAAPHPIAWRAEQGANKLDWAEWMMKNAGNAGRVGVCRVLEKVCRLRH